MLLWKDELGLAQAVWVLEVENFGPFLVECDVQGRSLFGMANAEVNETFEKLYEGLPQPALKRLGEVILPTEEVLIASLTAVGHRDSATARPAYANRWRSAPGDAPRA